MGEKTAGHGYRKQHATVWFRASDTNRDGNAWLGVLTALVTVHPVAKGTDAG